MNKGARLEVSHGLEIVKHLKAVLSEFAQREEQLSRTAATQRQNARGICQSGLSQAAENISARIARLKGESDAGEKVQTARHAARRARIQRFHSATLRGLPREALRAKEAWMGELQMKRFQAERKRDAALQAAQERFNQSAVNLGQMKAALNTLRARARNYFGGYLGLGLKLKRITETGTFTGSQGCEELFKEFQNQLTDTADQLQKFRAFMLPRLFSYLPVFVPALLIVVGCAIAGYRAEPSSRLEWGAFGAVLLAFLFGVHHLGLRRARESALAALHALSKVTDLHGACREALARTRDTDIAAAKSECARTLAEIDERWKDADGVEAEFEGRGRNRVEKRAPKALARNDRLLEARMRAIRSLYEERSGQATEEGNETKRRLEAERDSLLTASSEEARKSWEMLVADWKRETEPIVQEIGEIQEASAASSVPFGTLFVEEWVPPDRFAGAVRFGSLDFALESSLARPRNRQLQLALPDPVSLPLSLVFPEQGSLLFETREPCGGAVMAALNNIVLRLFTASPPGKVSFTIIDPVGLGQNFSGFMHLSDYEDSLINRRIWTQKDQIEQRLGELSEHIEKVIQMYLRDEYATIAEYNEQAGSVAEKYHFLLVADFPSGFSEIASTRLQSIVSSGARCGIFTLVHWDQRQQLPDDFGADELRRNSVCVQWDKGVPAVRGQDGGSLILDSPPTADVALALVHKIGKSSIDSNRVQVPFSMVAPPSDEIWKGDTTNELRVAIGRTGATKLQFLAIGKGTRQHALFAGKTGSGKSTLFHVIITNLALTVQPGPSGVLPHRLQKRRRI